MYGASCVLRGKLIFMGGSINEKRFVRFVSGELLDRYSRERG